MNTDELSKAFQALGIPKTHATVGISNVISSNKLYLLDTNNKTLAIGGDNEDEDSRWCGVGEREGRVFSSLVAQRHFGLSHGIGRSGDITEPQPKAAGSSVLARLALFMTLDALRRGCGLNPQGPASHGILLPMCTGMSMSLVLSSMRSEDPMKCIVLWSRIDQKSCYKAISSAGLTCVVVPTKVDGDAVITDMEAMETAMNTYEGRILAVITTTSCFAPRVPDSIDKVAQLCAKKDIHHVINNAYGLQCAQTCKLINRACVVGRVDAIVCSTDKNFLVPVGGAIVISPSKMIIKEIGKIYAGRASATPIIDVFITLLSMGMKGYIKLLEDRNKKLETFPSRLQEVAKKHGERLLICPGNTISFGVTLDGLGRRMNESEDESDYTKSVGKEISSFGAMLFSRCISGTRVIPRAQVSKIGDHEFVGFGSSTSNFPHAYMTAACAIGVSAAEVTEFFVRLDKALIEFKSKKSNPREIKSVEI